MSKFEVRTDRVRIDAPTELVWSVLTETEKYAEWNPFTPQVQTDFKIGSPAHLRVRMGPTKMKITETVCAFEKPRLIAWTKTFGARWLLVAVRQQVLEPVDETSCTYHNTDQLTGLLAPVVLLFQRELHAPRLRRCGRRTETLCGGDIREKGSQRGSPFLKLVALVAGAGFEPATFGL